MKPHLDKNAIEPDDDARVDRAGMPSVGRKRRGGKLMNIAVLAGIAGIGLGYAMLTTGAEKKDAPKPNTEEVANRLAPLPLPADSAAPPPLPDQPPPLSQIAAIAPGEAAPAKHEPTWQERKLGFGEAEGVLASAAGAASSGLATLSSSAAGALDAAGAALAPAAAAPGSLAARLEPGSFPMARASFLPDRNYVLAAGTLLDCILDTRIDSTLPGLVKCHLPRDVYSDNKQVLLLERGTELLGQQAGAIQQGQARQFVVFTRLKTEHGVIANLNSPAADALGGAGIPGWVDTRFGQRFGAALGIALLQDTAAVAVASQSRGGGQNTLVLGNTAQAGGTMAEKALESTVNLPPVLHVQQGALIQVMLARDVDFRDVYDLERKAP